MGRFISSSSSSTDGNTIAFSYLSQIILIDSNKNELWRREFEKTISDLLVSSDGSAVAILFRNTIVLINRNGEKYYEYTADYTISCFAISSQGNVIVFCSGSKIYYLKLGKKLREIKPPFSFEEDVYISLSNDGDKIVVASGVHLCLYEYSDNLNWRAKLESSEHFTFNNYVSKLVFSAKSDAILVETILKETGDCELWLFNSNGEKLWSQLTKDRVKEITISSNGDRIGGISKSEIFLLDQNGNELFRKQTKNVGQGEKISMSSDGGSIIAGSGLSLYFLDRDGVLLWEKFIIGNSVCSKLSYSSILLDVAVSSDSSQIIASYDEGVVSYDGSGTKLFEICDPNYNVCETNDNLKESTTDVYLPSRHDFQRILVTKINTASTKGKPFIVVKAGELHRLAGGYPGPNHRMPTCCRVMYSLMEIQDKIIAKPKKGFGATLEIQYLLPRTGMRLNTNNDPVEPESFSTTIPPKVSLEPKSFSTTIPPKVSLEPESFSTTIPPKVSLDLENPKKSLKAKISLPDHNGSQKKISDLSLEYSEFSIVGTGGFGHVYKAKRKDGVVVAVKIPVLASKSSGQIFLNEIENWKRLKHQNIVQILDCNIYPYPYIELEFCENSLADFELPCSIEEAAWIIFNVCEGLRSAHKNNLLHRDLKPQNILLKDGVVKITDWGLSRLVSSTSTTTSASFSSVYAAPEQITSKPKSAATDIWQVGVVFYELLTGNLPFGGESMVEIGMSIVQAEPVPPSEHNQDAKPFDTIILRCLEKDPKNRYQSVSALQKDLSEAMNGQYAHLLKQSVSTNDMKKSACYCGELVLINLTTGQLSSAYRYANDLVQYATGDVQEMAKRIAAMIQLRIQEQTGETIPAELLQMVEMLVHNVRMGVR